MEKKKRGFTITALVLSIIAIVLSFIPIINFISVIIAIIAIIFVITIIRKNKSKLIITSLILSVISILITIAITTAIYYVIESDAKTKILELQEVEKKLDNNLEISFGSENASDSDKQTEIPVQIKNISDKDYTGTVSFIVYDDTNNKFGTTSSIRVEGLKKDQIYIDSITLNESYVNYEKIGKPTPKVIDITFE